MMTTEYFILARVKGLPQNQLVPLLQKAYNEGAAGSYETMEESDGSILVVFLRLVEDDYEIIKSRVARTGEDIGQAAIEQLVEELGNAEDDIKTKLVVQQIRDTAWFPFPDGLAREVKEGEE